MKATKQKNNNPLYVAMGERLKKLRKERGLTQAQLAEDISQMEESNRPDCSSVQIGYMERGDREISYSYARLLGKYFGVSTSFILCEDDGEDVSAIIKHETNKERALSVILSVYGMSFEIGTDGLSDIERIAKYHEAKYNDIPDAFIMKSENGEIILECNYEEYKELVEELHDFLFYKIERMKAKYMRKQ